MKKQYKSSVVSSEWSCVTPCVPILNFMDNAVFLGQTTAWNRSRILSPKHIHPKVLLLCVCQTSQWFCVVVLEVFKRGGPYSFPAHVLMLSKVIKGEGLTEPEVDACTEQVTFVSLGPSVVILYLPW